MSLTARTLIKARTASASLQRRTFIDYLTNYPDKVRAYLNLVDECESMDSHRGTKRERDI
jgi:hypothetical protein